MDRRDLGRGAALRPLRLKDARELFALIDANRDHIGRWLSWAGTTRKVADTRRFLAAAVAQEEDRTGLHCAILVDGAIAGVVGAEPILTQAGWSEIGYWIGREHQGEGLVTRAVTAMLDHLFHERGLHRVQLRCAVTNERSRAIPERLGFTKEGRLREIEQTSEGREDAFVYGLLAREWREP